MFSVSVTITKIKGKIKQDFEMLLNLSKSFPEEC